MMIVIVRNHSLPRHTFFCWISLSMWSYIDAKFFAFPVQTGPARFSVPCPPKSNPFYFSHALSNWSWPMRFPRLNPSALEIISCLPIFLYSKAPFHVALGPSGPDLSLPMISFCIQRPREQGRFPVAFLRVGISLRGSSQINFYGISPSPPDKIFKYLSARGRHAPCSRIPRIPSTEPS